MTRRLELLALQGLPLVAPGDDLAELICRALERSTLRLEPGDVLVLAQKIVSKAEDRYVALASVEPGARALELAALCGKDPRLVELILRESRAVLRVAPGVLVVEHRNGYVHANAGIDRSNIERDPLHPRVLLLPADPDASAHALRERLGERTGVTPQVIINDSTGRAWLVAGGRSRAPPPR